MPSTPELNKALVDAFNTHNFGSNVDTNFLVEGLNIVVKFGGNKAYGQEYLELMGEEVRKEHFTSKKDSSIFFDLDSFPFKFDKGRWVQSEDDEKRGVIKFVVPASQAVISNLKYHFIVSRIQTIKARMIRELVCYGFDKEEAQDHVKKSIGFSKTHKPFRNSRLCLSFQNEGFMNNFVKKYKEDMKWSDDDFLVRWKVDDLNMKERCVELRDIKLATEKTRELIGFFFDTPSSEDQLIKKYKNAISDLIFRETGIPILCYHRDPFVNQSRIDNGEHFAFIPEVQEESIGETYLTHEEADKINSAFGFDLLNDIEGQTAETRLCNNGGIYALTNKQIASLIPEIIRESVITKIDDSYGLAIDYDEERSRSSSQESSAVTSPTHPSLPPNEDAYIQGSTRTRGFSREGSGRSDSYTGSSSSRKCTVKSVEEANRIIDDGYGSGHSKGSPGGSDDDVKGKQGVRGISDKHMESICESLDERYGEPQTSMGFLEVNQQCQRKKK